ncbi:hypothetical protein BDW02DRAFT_500035 [Decorospora gaudefroyi]|uniref:RING-type domain-containing protein n=1 Tax=Decorospora gaudefroyi TaxID=184978 RepID=A0A6A5K7B8_9PLEO|nr:hypothetical protein BDW02DRAFT_500035 [Decorospora gaudefroyi]
MLQSPRNNVRPRRSYIPHRSPSYTRIIRLEGQILSLVSILKFHLRYAPSWPDTALTALRLAVLPMYFEAIDRLIFHIDHGIDFNRARNADGLIYVARPRPSAVENEDHWPKTLWFAEFQRGFEDDSVSIAEALKRGWEWFMDLDGFPARYTAVKEWALGWHELEAEKRRQFLEVFQIDRDALLGMAREVKGMSLTGPAMLNHEKTSCVVGFLEQKRPLDVVLPRMVNPSRQKLGECSICKVGLLKEEVGTTKEHRPVEIPCRHIFGASCIKNHFAATKRWVCPACGTNHYAVQHHPTTASEVLESCDRLLKWLDPPALVHLPVEPHSYLDKLTLIFEPADAIRKDLHNWNNEPRDSYAEYLRLSDLALYLTRDRLHAAIRGDTDRFREVVAQQVQIGSRIVWLEFLWRCHPNSPA